MSLESQVAELTAVNKALADYYNTKKAAIDASVSAAVAAAPAIFRTFYVDPQLGSDANLGTRASPFRTIQRAVDSTPAAGRCEAWLLNDCTLDSHVILDGRQLAVRGEIGAGRRLVINEFTREGDPLPRMGSFWQSYGSTLDLSNLTVSLPASSQGDLSAYHALTFSSGSTAPNVLQLRLHNIVFELRGTFRGRIVGPDSPMVALGFTGTAIPAALAGRFVPSVAAGTDTKTLSHVITNAPTL
ncbi:hypothetical protein E4195_11690 [Pseudomonas putida]|uniref:hypothetical protein n=1 Tax=Pseudomonas putida TaxID=303 RepID=UPI0010751D6C|nr:hypothetical protein [Pseudomonas putida]TFW37610.1 hypothetical protein E4195_11690 [Pseudomonas putida]